MTDVQNKIVYSFHPITGEFLGEAFSDPNELEPGEWLDPADTTDTAPPKAVEGKCAIFDGKKWFYLDDYRGQVWFKEDGTEVIIKDLGDPTSLGLLKDKPILPEPELIIPESIARRQFFQQAAVSGFITEAEALTGMVGTLPTAMKEMIEKLSQEYRFPAMALAVGAQSFERSNPLTTVVAQSLGMTEEDVDQFWRAAAQL